MLLLLLLLIELGLFCARLIMRFSYLFDRFWLLSSSSLEEELDGDGDDEDY